MRPVPPPPPFAEYESFVRASHLWAMFAVSWVFEYPLPIFPTEIEITFPFGLTLAIALNRFPPLSFCKITSGPIAILSPAATVGFAAVNI